MVHLPAMNTPQFDWALNKMEPASAAGAADVSARGGGARRSSLLRRAPPARGLGRHADGEGNLCQPSGARAAGSRVGEDWAKSGQLASEPVAGDAPANLFAAVPGPYGAHGRFDARARPASWEFFASRHRTALAGGVALAIAALLGKRWSQSHRRLGA